MPIILLAESNPALQRLLGKLLAEEGFGVVVAGTRRAVLEQLRVAPRIDVVIADYGLRGMPAWEVVQETSWRRPGVPCVRLVESRADALPVYGVDPAAETILQRPVTITDLLAAVYTLLSHRAVERPTLTPG